MVFAVALAPWVYRNHTRFNAFVLSSSGDVNIRVYAENLNFYFRNGNKDTLQVLMEKEGWSNAANNYQKSLIEKRAGMAD